MTTQEGLPALATDAELAELRDALAQYARIGLMTQDRDLFGCVLARLEAAERQVKELRGALTDAKEWLSGWASAEPYLSKIIAALEAKEP